MRALSAMGADSPPETEVWLASGVAMDTISPMQPMEYWASVTEVMNFLNPELDQDASLLISLLELDPGRPSRTVLVGYALRLRDPLAGENAANSAAISSYDDLRYNDDGSVDLYLGPTAPVRFENNWVQTIPGRGWWVWFRFYGPGEAFFDKSWQLPDFERIE